MQRQQEALDQVSCSKRSRLSEQAYQSRATALATIFGVVERQGSKIEIIDQLAICQHQSACVVGQSMHGGVTPGAARKRERLARVVDPGRGTKDT
jgi:hypothetical protein